MCDVGLSSSYTGLLTLTLVSFRQVPVFGETTIRRFDGNVSDMKRLAGHDFEDLLQVTRHFTHPQTATDFRPR